MLEYNTSYILSFALGFLLGSCNISTLISLAAYIAALVLILDYITRKIDCKKNGSVEEHMKIDSAADIAKLDSNNVDRRNDDRVDDTADEKIDIETTDHDEIMTMMKDADDNVTTEIYRRGYENGPPMEEFHKIYNWTTPFDHEVRQEAITKNGVAWLIPT